MLSLRYFCDSFCILLSSSSIEDAVIITVSEALFIFPSASSLSTVSTSLSLIFSALSWLFFILSFSASFCAFLSLAFSSAFFFAAFFSILSFCAALYFSSTAKYVAVPLSLTCMPYPLTLAPVAAILLPSCDIPLVALAIMASYCFL